MVDITLDTFPYPRGALFKSPRRHRLAICNTKQGYEIFSNSYAGVAPNKIKIVAKFMLPLMSKMFLSYCLLHASLERRKVGTAVSQCHLYCHHTYRLARAYVWSRHSTDPSLVTCHCVRLQSRCMYSTYGFIEIANQNIECSATCNAEHAGCETGGKHVWSNKYE